MKRELFAVAGGFGYDIVDDAGRVTVHQPFKPGVPGDQAMTDAEATAAADAMLWAPSLGCDRATLSFSRADAATLTVDIGPDAYTGVVRWYEGDTLLGEINAVSRHAVLEYAPDRAGGVIIRAGNDAYGWAQVELEVVG